MEDCGILDKKVISRHNCDKLYITKLYSWLIKH